MEKMRKRKDRENKEGYSLVELLIAIAVSSVVMLTMIGLLGYGAKSMNLTQAKVALQEQAKDSLNHISAYVQESGDARWDDTTHTNMEFLVLMKTGVKNDGNVEASETLSMDDVYYYWHMKPQKTIYFASRKTLLMEQGISEADAETDTTTVVLLKNDKKHMLAEHVEDFEAKVVEDSETKKKTIHVVMKLKDDISEYNCERDINMRNQ